MSMDSAAGRSWLLVAAIALIAVTLRASGCSEPTPVPDPLDGFDLAAFFAGVADDQIGAAYADFVLAADQLEADTIALRDAVAGGTDAPADWDAAGARWAEAFAVWQGAEVLLIGAVADPPRPGGEALRDAIYSWPTVNDCLIDQGLVDERYGDADFFTTSLVNAYGLDALEWLLLGPRTETRCPSQVVDPTTWTALADELPLRRAEYAVVVAGGIAAAADDVQQRWGSARDQLVAPAEGGLWATERESLQQIYEALFYVELVVKDRKLARPLGLLDCTSGSTCPEDLEAPWAGGAIDAVRANLDAFAQVVAGVGEGPGLTDLLEYAGEPDAAIDLLAATDQAIATAAALGAEDPAALLAEDPAALGALHADLKVVTDQLKGDVALLLALTVPIESSGDND